MIVEFGLRILDAPLVADSAFHTAHSALEWWEVLVMLQSSLPTLFCDTGFTDRQPEHLPHESK
jgi:hypothetical protein